MGKFYSGVVFLSLFLLAGCGREREVAPRPVPINPKGDLLSSQEPGAVKNWFTKDPEQDGVEGTSADKAYVDFKLKTGVKPILVAIIDSGVDIEHEDLKAHVWNNPGETGLDARGNDKASNGIDDDENGYIDDVHGWNFLGSYDKDHKPVNLVHTTLEVTRQLVKMKQLKKERELKGESLTADESAYLTKLQADFDAEKTSATETLTTVGPLPDLLKAQYDILKNVLKVTFDLLTLVDITAIQSTDPKVLEAQASASKLFKDSGLRSVAQLNRELKNAHNALDFYLNEGEDPRSLVIKDNPDDVTDHHYGNNDVRGSDGEHGSHVAGIIGAIRNNGIGVNGVATDVEFMVVRAVPDGDEADKDVANAVRYAVDNGAQIINMSFGKAYSPHKDAVDAAFKYAADKNVLIVHAAGNENKDTDVAANFPNRLAQSGGEIPGWLEVGASSQKKGVTLPAVFSNYGKQAVDLFAPGVAIESTIPEKNQYAVFSGTSMASPTVAGVAALILSQHPTMKATELKDLLLSTARLYPGLQVNQPNDRTLPQPVMVNFDTLSKTGGIVDAFTALKKVAGF